VGASGCDSIFVLDLASGTSTRISRCLPEASRWPSPANGSPGSTAFAATRSATTTFGCGTGKTFLPTRNLVVSRAGLVYVNAPVPRLNQGPRTLMFVPLSRVLTAVS